MSILNLLPTMRSARSWKSRTAAVRLLHIACRRRKYPVKALRTAQILDESTMATTHPMLLIIHNYRQWELRRHFHACRRHRSRSGPSGQSITNRLLGTWMLMKTTMMRAKKRNQLFPSQSVEAQEMHPRMACLMLQLQLNKSRRRTGLIGLLHHDSTALQHVLLTTRVFI